MACVYRRAGCVDDGVLYDVRWLFFLPCAAGHRDYESDMESDAGDAKGGSIIKVCFRTRM